MGSLWSRQLQQMTRGEQLSNATYRPCVTLLTICGKAVLRSAGHFLCSFCDSDPCREEIPSSRTATAFYVGINFRAQWVLIWYQGSDWGSQLHCSLVWYTVYRVSLAYALLHGFVLSGSDPHAAFTRLPCLALLCLHSRCDSSAFITFQFTTCAWHIMADIIAFVIFNDLGSVLAAVHSSLCRLCTVIWTCPPPIYLSTCSWRY